MDIRRRMLFKKNAISNEGPINIDNYLTIEALKDGLTASLSTNSCEYCVDGDGNWKSLAAGTATESINSGHTLSFRGNLTPVKNVGIGTFTISKKCNLSGKCASMLYGDGAADNYSISSKAYAFYMLFTNNTTIIDASQLELPTDTSNYCYNAMFYQCRNLIGSPTLGTSTSLGCYNSMFRECDRLVVPPALPATVAASGCYKRMFQDCPSLLEAPELPARGINEQCYQYMFSGCTSLTTAPELSAVELARHCYQYMFQNCKSLTTAPELPATTLAYGCYMYMFSDCTSLTTAPELPATTLANLCYRYMFSGCTSLTTAPKLPATTLASHCYEGMFSDCTSLTTAPKLPVTTLAYGCYYYMFYGCTSLKSAPELPATTLADYCYNSMFSRCTSLTTAPELPATTLSNECYNSMFYNCTSLTTAPELPATNLAESCYTNMFYNCTSLTTAPELPATTLTNWCYNAMFNGCAKLNYIKMLATDISASNCLIHWVYNVASTGTFVKHPAMTTLPTGAHGIPSGWTVVNDGEESGGGKIVNKITFKNSYTDGPEVYAKRYCDFTPTSHVDITFYSVSGTKTGSTFVSPSSHADVVGIPLGLTFDAPFTAEWTPKEDDTYIYEVIIEQ